MKHLLPLLIAFCLLSLAACSDDKADTAAFDELKIELNNDGYIVSPLWMKQLVDDSEFKSPEGEVTHGILMFSGVYVDGTPYIKTGLFYAASWCLALQIYRLNGEQLECFSPEYDRVRAADKSKDHFILWSLPSLSL